MGILGWAKAGIGLWEGKKNREISKENLQQQKENLAWQRQAQQTTWQREDNAVQRRAADLKKAGLSPVLAAGSAANSGAVINTQAPQDSSQYGEKTQAIENVINTRQAIENIKNTEADRMRIIADVEQKHAGTKVLLQDEENRKMQRGLLAAQTALAYADTSKKRKEIKKVIEETANINAKTAMNKYDLAMAKSGGTKTNENDTLINMFRVMGKARENTFDNKKVNGITSEAKRIQADIQKRKRR